LYGVCDDTFKREDQLISWSPTRTASGIFALRLLGLPTVRTLEFQGAELASAQHRTYKKTDGLEDAGEFLRDSTVDKEIAE
jgi:hypothetical protein